MISTRSVGLVIDTFVCLTLAKWETVSGHFGGYLTDHFEPLEITPEMIEAGIGEVLDYDPESRTPEELVVRILLAALGIRCRFPLLDRE